MSKNESSLLIWLLVGIDLSLMFLNVFPTGNGGIDDLFALDLESNFVVWYSSSKLLVASVLCWQAAELSVKSKWPLRVSAFACLAISISETAMIHERLYGAIHTLTQGFEMIGVGGGIWVLYLAPFIVFTATILALAFFRTGKQFPRTRIPLLIAFSLWVIVLIAETAPRWAAPLETWLERFFMLLEESCELFGTTALILGMYAVRQETHSAPIADN